MEDAAGGCRGHTQVLQDVCGLLICSVRAGTQLVDHQTPHRPCRWFVAALQAADGRLTAHAVVPGSAGSGRAPSVRAEESGIRPSASLPLAGSGRAEAGFGTGPDPPGQDSSYGPRPVRCQETGETPETVDSVHKAASVAIALTWSVF